MDCEMPIMDGYTSSKMMREWEAENGLPRTMIVGVSGNSGEQFEKKCRANGMDMMITKPISVEQLRRLVEQSVLRML
jgi:CheY-like chemotaxis protein